MRMAQQLPPGVAHVALDTAQLPHILQKIFLAASR